MTVDSIQAVNVMNIYSVLNGLIMVFAGFNYLALRYQNAIPTEYVSILISIFILIFIFIFIYHVLEPNKHVLVVFVFG